MGIAAAAAGSSARITVKGWARRGSVREPPRISTERGFGHGTPSPWGYRGGGVEWQRLRWLSGAVAVVAAGDGWLGTSGCFRCCCCCWEASGSRAANGLGGGRLGNLTRKR